MIHEVDNALESFLSGEVLQDSGVDVSFEAPTKDWAQKRTSPIVNLYLYDIREDSNRRQVGIYETRNELGELLARTEPPRFFRLSYLITAYAARPLDEHRLLSAVLISILPHKVLPTEYLSGNIADANLPVMVEIGKAPVENRQISDVWTAFGGELKASLDLVVTVAMPSTTVPINISLAKEGALIRTHGFGGQESVVAHDKANQSVDGRQ